MSNTTTIVRGWKMTRKDGQILAFTDCDIDLDVDGVTYEASAALTPSEAVASTGLAVDEQEVKGGLSSSAISENDLAAGLYDGATVDVIEINWADMTLHQIVGTYNIGEVSRTEAAFTAELRSEAGNLSQIRGAYVLGPCNAELGDSRCKFDISGLAVAGAIVQKTGDVEFVISGPAATSSDRYTAGTLVWTSGANLGQTQEVSYQRVAALGLWRAPLFEVAAGDTFDLFPGCDKSFETCLATYKNGDNFRGFPTVTGESSLSYAVPGEGGLDGGSYYKFGA